MFAFWEFGLTTKVDQFENNFNLIREINFKRHKTIYMLHKFYA